MSISISNSITAGTLVPRSVNGDIAIQWEWSNFDPSHSGVAKVVREVRTAPGGNLLGAANGQFKKKSRENADCKFHM